MTLFGPTDQMTHRSSANAQVALQDRAGAKADLQRAFALDPTNPFTAARFFEAQLGANEIEEAMQTLEQVRPHLGKWTTLECDAKLATRRRDHVAAKEALHALCLGPAESTTALIGAANAFYEAGWGVDVERVFRAASSDPECNPEVGALFAERIVQHKVWGRRKEVYALLDTGELGRRAFVVYTNALGERKKTDLLERLVDRYRKWLHADTRTWASVGYALAACGLFRKNTQWMKDWRTRKDAEAWHLYNLVLCLRHLGRDREAHEVSLRALALPNQDQSHSDHQLWLALDDAISGDTHSAAERLREFESHGLKDCARLLRMMIKSIMEVRESPKGDRRAEFRSARRRLRREFQEKIGNGPAELRRAYCRTIRRMAKDARTWPGIAGFVGPLSMPNFKKLIGI